MGYDLTKTFYELQAAKYAADTVKLRLDSLWDTFSSLLTPGADVLDLGCGSGRDLKELALRGFHVVGLEYSEALTKEAREYSHQKVQVGDMRVFDPGQSQFDGIWAVASLLHIRRVETPGVLKKLYNALRSDGILFTSMKKGYGNQTGTDGRLFELYQPQEWELVLKVAGFKVEEQQVSTETREIASGNTRQIEWFVTIARKRPSQPRSSRLKKT